MVQYSQKIAKDADVYRHKNLHDHKSAAYQSETDSQLQGHNVTCCMSRRYKQIGIAQKRKTFRKIFHDANDYRSKNLQNNQNSTDSNLKE